MLPCRAWLDHTLPDEVEGIDAGAAAYGVPGCDQESFASSAAAAAVEDALPLALKVTKV